MNWSSQDVADYLRKESWFYHSNSDSYIVCTQKQADSNYEDLDYICDCQPGEGDLKEAPVRVVFCHMQQELKKEKYLFSCSQVPP